MSMRDKRYIPTLYVNDCVESVLSGLINRVRVVLRLVE